MGKDIRGVFTHFTIDMTDPPQEAARPSHTLSGIFGPPPLTNGPSSGGSPFPSPPPEVFDALREIFSKAAEKFKQSPDDGAPAEAPPEEARGTRPVVVEVPEGLRFIGALFLNKPMCAMSKEEFAEFMKDALNQFQCEYDAVASPLPSPTLHDLHSGEPVTFEELGRRLRDNLDAGRTRHGRTPAPAKPRRAGGRAKPAAKAPKVSKPRARKSSK